MSALNVDNMDIQACDTLRLPGPHHFGLYQRPDGKCYGAAMLRSKYPTLALFTAWMACGCAFAAEPHVVNILYAEQQYARAPSLSNQRPRPSDIGLAGARLAIIENNTTGKFTHQEFHLEEFAAPEGSRLAEALKGKISGQLDLIVLNATAPDILGIADLPQTKHALIFNAAARDENAREEDCRANVLHSIPSRSMLTDALAQFFAKKRWINWLLISGSRANDKAYADSVRASAVKFGMNIAADKTWDSDADLRESAAVEVPLLTQGEDYDAVVIADENDDFGPLIAFNTWLPRPVAGTHGLVPAGWSPAVEPWGAVQLQNRFRQLAKREMGETDFAAWLAVRIIGEAVTRTGKSDAASIRSYVLSDQFQMSAFKGRGVSFRNWNGQLRQPIHLVTSDAQVALAPLEGFLHQSDEMDTLGLDRSETRCAKFAEAAAK
jgi:ABC transporter substrate binding protein (PQQ-dependent alcohol dehydrogenase system)